MKHFSLFLLMRKVRIKQLDTIRALAIISVLICHSLESIYNTLPEVFVTYPTATQIVLIIIRLFGRIGVPFFLFLTGYLLLSRDYSKDNIKSFYIHKLLPLLICWELWIVIHNILSPFLLGNNFDLASTIRQLLFIDYLPYSHSWYMPMIIGIYIFIPLVSLALNKVGGKTILFTMSIVYFYFFVVATMSHYFSCLGKNFVLSNYLDLSFSGSVYGFYIIIGYLATRYKTIIKSLMTPFFRIALLLLALISIIVTVLFQYFCYHSLNPYGELWYDLFTIPIISTILFILIINTKPFFITASTNISHASFGIYLIHRIVQIFIVKYIFEYLDISKSFKLIILLPASFTISYIAVKAFCKLFPKASGVLFLCK